MLNGISITVSASDRKRLQGLAGDRSGAQKHGWRAVAIREDRPKPLAIRAAVMVMDTPVRMGHLSQRVFPFS
jgi:hypothetical protein